MGSGASGYSTPFLCILSLPGAGLRLPWYPLPGGTLLVRCRLAVPGHAPHFTSALGCPRDGPFLAGITRGAAPCSALGSPRPPCGLCTLAVASAVLEARRRLRLQIAPSCGCADETSPDGITRGFSDALSVAAVLRRPGVRGPVPWEGWRVSCIGWEAVQQRLSLQPSLLRWRAQGGSGGGSHVALHVPSRPGARPAEPRVSAGRV